MELTVFESEMLKYAIPFVDELIESKHEISKNSIQLWFHALTAK